MNPSILIAATPGVHGGTILGHDINGWTVAMICAIVAAFIYEAVMALTRAVTLRIPFLVLQLARLQVRMPYRSRFYPMWRSELWAILRAPGAGRLRRFFTGMAYAGGLALRGARASAKVKAEGESLVETRDELSKDDTGTLKWTVATTGVVSGGIGMLLPMWGVRLSTAASMTFLAIEAAAILLLMLPRARRWVKAARGR